MTNTFIIAEVGVNHNSDVGLAFEMIDAAAESGADAVKFQAAIPDLVVTAQAPKSEYQKINRNLQETQLDLIRSLHLPLKEFFKLKERCEKRNVVFFASAFDLVSLDFIEKLGQEFHKVPSGEITNFPYLQKIGEFNKATLLSTGMSNINEIRDALDVLKTSGLEERKITILHCNTQYPTPFDDVNLRVLKTLRDSFGTAVGYSDHTDGFLVAVAAVALGATVIEKHFTLNQNLPGPDQKASLEPSNFRSMVESIRNIEVAMGSDKKTLTKSESENITLVRRSIVASKPIKEGEQFSSDNIVAKRPANGLSPMRWNLVIGKQAKRDFHKDELIEL